MNTRLCLVALLVASTGCRPPTPAALPEADQQAIRQADEAAVNAIVAKDWAAWASFFTEDATILPPHGTAVEGRAAIQTWGEAFPPIAAFQGALTEVDGRGDLAYVRGTYSMTVTPPGATAPVADHGKYIGIWRKQPDGSWKVLRDIFNSDVPLPARATPSR